MSMGCKNEHHEYHTGDNTVVISEWEKDSGVYIDYQLKIWYSYQYYDKESKQNADVYP